MDKDIIIISYDFDDGHMTSMVVCAWVDMWVVGTGSGGKRERGDDGDMGAGRPNAQNGNPIWNALMMAVPES